MNLKRKGGPSHKNNAVFISDVNRAEQIIIFVIRNNNFYEENKDKKPA
jgi:hypothetical protein